MAGRKKRRKKAKKIELPVCYLVKIEGWDWSFSFGLNNMRREMDPYHDFRHLEITGSLLNPKAVIEKAPKAALTFIPKNELNETKRMEFEPLSVGSLDTRDGVLRGLISMPLDALPPVLQALSAGTLKYVVMDGPKLRYRQTRLHHYSLDTNIDPDELMLDDDWTW